MQFTNAVLSSVLCLGVLGLFESLARRFWHARWNARGYSAAWMNDRATLVRLGSALTAAVVAGITYQSASAIAAFTALAWLSALAVATDLTTHKIPSEPIWLAIWIATFAISWELAATGSVNGNPGALFDLLIAQAVVLGTMLFTVIITVGGIGSGDLRLVAALTMLTAWVGAGAVIPALLLASIGYAVTRKALRIPLGPTAGDGEPVPFAPGLVGGYWTVVLLLALSTIVAPESLIAG